MMHRLQSARRYARAHGARATLRAGLRKLWAGQLPPKKRDIIGHYNQILGFPHGREADLARQNPPGNTLQWVIPSFGFGSGGHLNIFRFINNLDALGFDQRVVILPPYGFRSAAHAAGVVAEWYMPLAAKIELGIAGFAPSDITIATGWQTAYWTAHYRATRARFYFVQDFEPAFYANSSEYVLAENTYRLGLRGITAGDWLKQKLADEYGMRTGAVSFGCDTDFYKPAPRDDNPAFRIFFYARHVTQRRLFELGLLALSDVCQRHPNVEVIFAGGDVSGIEIPFKHLNAGELPLNQLPGLYAQCDLGLVLSGTNLSLVPLELAACKCPVVMNDAPSVRWLLPPDAAFYAPPTPQDIADALSRAIVDPKARQSVADRAYDFACGTSWVREAQEMKGLFERLR
jgi:glycosyltransferase involved in cell wall biosynthesis